MNATGRFGVRKVADAQPRTHNNVTARPLFDQRNDALRSSTSYLWYTTIEAGQANAAHVHEDIEKIYYILDGSAHIVCGEDAADVSPGEAFFLPAEVEHSITNSGDTQLRMLVYASKILPDTEGTKMNIEGKL